MHSPYRCGHPWLKRCAELAPAKASIEIFGSAEKLFSSLAALGAALAGNRWLDKWSANNWTPTQGSRLGLDEEVVLVTGGSSGVGASIVRLPM